VRLTATRSSTGGLMTIHHLGVGLALEMLSALIPSRSSYPAMLVFQQQAHQGSVPPGPLVLWRTPLKNRALALDRDRQIVTRKIRGAIFLWTLSMSP